MHDPVTLSLHVHCETAAAVEVSADGLIAHAAWVPKSMIEIAEPIHRGRRHEVTLPRGLAEARRLLI